MPSEPEQTRIPASSKRLTGGAGRDAGPVVMMPISSSASCSIIGSTRSRSGAPRQKAWLTTTWPCMPSARVRSKIKSNENAPISPGSCKWMSSGRPYFWARPKIASRWPLGSRSMPQGSMPPTTSAPSRMAWSINSSVPGRRNKPDWGKATMSMSMMSAYAARVAITPSIPHMPWSVSTSTWERIWVVPWPTDKTTCRADCRAGSILIARLSWRSLSILSIKRGPASFGRQPMPHSDLSRCACASTSPGSTRSPPTSSTVASGAEMASAMSTI